MARGGSVLAGIRAVQQASSANAASPSYGGKDGLSPLLAQYGQWTLGRTSPNIALPRDPVEFLTGAFGPLAPIQPVGIDSPPKGEERPEPRRWQYPVGWNMPMGMPGTEGLKLADFQTLRLYSEMYSVARACIELRKNEMLGIGWDIGPTADAAKSMRGDATAMKDFQQRRGEALKFFRRPDPNFNDFASWFSAVLEDVFVIDALSLYLHPSRLPGKGLFGTSLAGLDLIDGSMVRPLLDLRGGSPSPPSPAYQIYQYGVPRVDMMTLLSQDDLKGMPPPRDQYRGDQLLYLPRNPRDWTPYGQSPLERCVIPVLTGLRKQQYALDFYQEGSIPGVYISPGDVNMTPNQIREVQDSLNAIAGDQAYKHKIIMLPANSKVDPQKPPELADQADEIIMSQVCMAYNVMPMELGVTPKVSTTQSPGAANQMAKASENINERKALKPDLLWMKSAIFDKILQDICGQHDMEWKWDGLEEDEDEETLTNLLVSQIGAGLSSIDEARIELGKQPWGLPITNDPGWANPTAGFTPLGTMSPTGAPEAGVPPPPPPGAPPAPGGAPGGAPPAPGAPRPPAQGMPGQQHPNVAAPPGRPQQAQQPAGGGAAHAAAATAANAQRHQPAPQRKAAMAELSALARHLNKGRHITTWEPRHIPGAVLASIQEDLSKGLTPDEAVQVATATFPPEHAQGPHTIGDPVEEANRHFRAYTRGERVIPSITKGGDPGDDVTDQLAEDYPKDKLGWVTGKGITWSGPRPVALDTVDMTHRKSWRASHEMDRVKAMAGKQVRKEGKGKHLKPVILVDTPDTDADTNLKVIDGHHRTLAARMNNRPVWAYVATVSKVNGPWDELHAAQKDVGDRDTTDFAATKAAWGAWEHDRRVAQETADALHTALGDAVDTAKIAEAWAVLDATQSDPGDAAGLLNAHGVPHAIASALESVLPGAWEQGWDLGVSSAVAQDGVARKWDKDTYLGELRDEHGRWTRGGAAVAEAVEDAAGKKPPVAVDSHATALATASDPHKVAASLSDDDLHAAHAELQRRRQVLGGAKPTRAEAAAGAELARRTGTAVKPVRRPAAPRPPKAETIPGWLCVRPPCAKGTRVRLNDDNTVTRRGKTGGNEVIGSVMQAQDGRWGFLHVGSATPATGVALTREQATQRLVEYHDAHLIQQHVTTAGAKHHAAETVRHLRAGDRAAAAKSVKELQERLAKDPAAQQLEEHTGYLAHGLDQDAKAATSIKPNVPLGTAPEPDDKDAEALRLSRKPLTPEEQAAKNAKDAAPILKKLNEQQRKDLEKVYGGVGELHRALADLKRTGLDISKATTAEEEHLMEELEHEHDKFERRQHLLKNAMHAGFILAGIALSFALPAFEVPILSGAVVAAIPAFAPEITDRIQEFRKKRLERRHEEARLHAGEHTIATAADSPVEPWEKALADELSPVKPVVAQQGLLPHMWNTGERIGHEVRHVGTRVRARGGKKKGE